MYLLFLVLGMHHMAVMFRCLCSKPREPRPVWNWMQSNKLCLAVLLQVHNTKVLWVPHCQFTTAQHLAQVGQTFFAFEGLFPMWKLDFCRHIGSKHRQIKFLQISPHVHSSLHQKQSCKRNYFFICWKRIWFRLLNWLFSNFFLLNIWK